MRAACRLEYVVVGERGYRSQTCIGGSGKEEGKEGRSEMREVGMRSRKVDK